jgi:hypothetical protein
MNANRSLEAIVTQWQAELDAGLEIGETPVFYLGYGPAMLGELAGPLALQWLDEERRDTRMPLAAGGGLSPYWLASLLHQRAADTPPRSPATVFCFTAPDRATHTAALTLLDTRRSQFRRRPADLPPGFQPQFVPGVQAGPFLGEMLPLQLAASDPMPTRAADETDFLSRGRDGWVAWTAVVAAVALLLIALVA